MKKILPTLLLFGMTMSPSIWSQDQNEIESEDIIFTYECGVKYAKKWGNCKKTTNTLWDEREGWVLNPNDSIEEFRLSYNDFTAQTIEIDLLLTSLHNIIENDSERSSVDELLRIAFAAVSIPTNEAETQKRINVLVQNSASVLENIPYIIDKYGPITSNQLSKISEIAKKDWSSKNRRTAVLMMAYFGKNQKVNKDLFQFMSDYDGMALFSHNSSGHNKLIEDLENSDRNKALAELLLSGKTTKNYGSFADFHDSFNWGHDSSRYEHGYIQDVKWDEVSR